MNALPRQSALRPGRTNVRFGRTAVCLARPNALKGFTGSRFAAIAEPLPAADTAEIWSFVVQYQPQNAPFGQMSQPVTITVRG